MFLRKADDIMNIIKEQIALLPTKENFNFGPYKGSETDEDIPKELKKYNVTNREVYDVLTDFDRLPNQLTNKQKQLRKKYLKIILALIDENRDMLKMKISKESGFMNIVPLLSGDGGMGGGGGMMGGGGAAPSAGAVTGGAPAPAPAPAPGAETFQEPEPVNYFAVNYDPLVNTIKRIITLLIVEIDLNMGNGNDPCNKTTYTVIMMILGLFLLFSIGYIIIKKNQW